MNIYEDQKYSVKNFLFDILMVCITGGLWLIWIFCREIRELRNDIQSMRRDFYSV